jgi:hypothetical protein
MTTETSRTDRTAQSYGGRTASRTHPAGNPRRGLTRAGAVFAVAALIAVASGSASAGAAPTSVPAGHTLCQEAYCTVFGPGAPSSHGTPGTQGLFTIFCPLVDQQVVNDGSSSGGPLQIDVQYDHAVPYVTTFPGGAAVTLTDYSQGINGDLAFSNYAFTVPDKSVDALTLTGGGYCVFDNDQYDVGLVESTEWDYFWIDNPTYWKLTSAVLAALAGQFGSMQLISDGAFGASGFGPRGSSFTDIPASGSTPTPPTTTTSKPGQREPATTTTSTTRPTTTTTGRRAAG